MSDSEVAEGAVEVVETAYEAENDFSGKRERRERRNDANGLPQTAQMQDLFGELLAHSSRRRPASTLAADPSGTTWLGTTDAFPCR